jgi:hypothetical protein
VFHNNKNIRPRTLALFERHGFERTRRIGKTR